MPTIVRCFQVFVLQCTLICTSKYLQYEYLYHSPCWYLVFVQHDSHVGLLLSLLLSVQNCNTLLYYSCINTFSAVLLDPNRGWTKGIPGVGESLLEVQRKQFIGTCCVRDLLQHEQAGTG